VSTVDGLGTISYQWKRDGAGIVNATDATYSVGSVDATSAGTYTCEVTDCTGSDVSPSVTVVVANPPSITGLTGGGNVYTGVTTEFEVTAVDGLGTITYDWVFDDGTTQTHNVSTSAKLTLNPVALDNGGTYFCIVADERANPVQSDNLVLNVAEALVIATDPAEARRYNGSDHTFEVVATGGAGALAYQWSKDGSPILDATDSTLPLTAVTTADEAEYTVTVTDEWNTTITTTAVSLEVGDHLSFYSGPTGGGNKYAGQSATFTVTVLGGIGDITYTWSKDGTEIASVTTNQYKITVPPGVVVGDSGDYSVSISDEGDSDGNIDTVTPPNGAVATLTVADPISVATDPLPAALYTGEALQLKVVAAGGYGTLTYQWLHDGQVVGTNSDTYSVAAVALTHAGDYSVQITDQWNSTVDSATVAVRVANAPAFTTQPQSHALYVGESTSLSVGVSGGLGTLHYEWVKNDTEVLPGDNSWYDITGADMADAGAYFVSVWDERVNPIRSNTATLKVGVPLRLNTGPIGVDTVMYTGEAPFPMAVQVEGGVGAIKYQWKQQTVGAKAIINVGANTPALTIDPTKPSDTGLFWCEVTDEWDAFVGGNTEPLKSNTVSLKVADHMAFTLQPQSVAKYTNDPHTFRTVVTGGLNPVHYTWKKDDLALPNSDANTYTINKLRNEDAGRYLVEAEDGVESIVSNTAVLTVSAGVPVAGLAGLALALGGCLLSGVAALRRRK
jgi:hypothetical protein